MNLRDTLAALYREADTLKSKGPDDLTDADMDRAPVLATEIKATEAAIEKQAAAAAVIKGLAPSAQQTTEHVAGGQEAHGADESGSLGSRFIKSAPFVAFRKSERGPVEGRPINFKADGLGRFHDIEKADPAPLNTTIGGGPSVTPTRLPGITDLTYRQPTRLLDIITRGGAVSSFLQYRALISITNNAAIVAEGAVKPLSTLAFDLRQAVGYTYADGVKVTNQELADDGVIANVVDTTLRGNLARKIEDIVLNGTGTNEPFGILNTTGVRQVAFGTDVPTTLRTAITVLQNTAEATVEAIVLNPTDAQNLALIRDNQGRYIGNGPFGAANDLVWQKPLVLSTKIPAGTALVGDFSNIALLDIDALSIQAFTQNEDDARHNLTYIRAEQRSLLLFRQPAKVAIVDLTA